MHRAAVLLLLIAAVAAFWQNAGSAPSDRLHTVTLAVKHRANAAATCDSLLMEVSKPGSPKYGKHKTLAEVNALVMDVEAVKRVENYLTSQGMNFVTVGDYIKVTAKVSELESIFSTKFNAFTHTKLGRTALKADNLVVPNEIINDIDVVLNTDIPRIVPRQILSTSMAQDTPITTPQLINKVYGIRNNTVTQSTQSLFEALGQNFSPDDLSQFQQSFNLPSIAVSKVTGNNDGGDCAVNPNSCGEANLDVQYMIAVAQSTETHYRVIDQSVQDPFYDWIIDLSQAQDPAHVHSVSYGSLAPEDPKNDMLRFNTETCKLGLRGVTIVVASGDDGVANFPARQDSSKCGFVPSFPATSPYVLAVGATQGPEAGTKEIACTSDAGGLITTGGGFSITFKRPSYQDKAVKNYFSIAKNLPNTDDFASNGRGYPDVSAMGHNYVIVDGGQSTAVSGTSASAPVFAAILTLINDQRLMNGKSTLGFVNPALYKAPSAVFNDITQGRNNCAAGQPGEQVCCDEGFTAAKGWDPLTGLGTPNFPKLTSYLARL